MVSFGGGKQKQKSKSSSSVGFNPGFFEDAIGYFGGDPGYNPQFVGFNDFDKLEKNIYDSANARTTDAYRGALNLQNEDLSNMGMLNSPAKFIEGGARDTLNKNYISSLQQAARDAALQRYGLQSQEAGRQTAFNVDTATKLFNAFLQKLQLGLAGANRNTKGEGSGTSMNYGASISGGDAGGLFAKLFGG